MRLAVPLMIEDFNLNIVDSLMEGRYKIGLGCRIMDGITDLQKDIIEHRHNFLISLIFHRSGVARTIRDHFKSWKIIMPDLDQLIDLNYLSMSIVMILSRNNEPERLYCRHFYRLSLCHKDTASLI